MGSTLDFRGARGWHERASELETARPGDVHGVNGKHVRFQGGAGVGMAVNDWDSGLMTVAETARVLHVPVSWVYERTRRRGKERIPHIKLGKYLRFEIAAVRSWLDGLRLT
jgi:hypothetical protein